MQHKTLLLDVETAPNMGYIWALYQKIYSMEMLAHDWYILCWCAKWLGDKKIHRSALPDHDLYTKQPTNDIEVMKPLWDLLNEAEIVVAHNAVQFDVKRINTRFLLHNLPPPAPFKVVDTLKVARRHFAFTSNKLNDLGQLLDVGKKEHTGGFRLWADCLAGKKSAWKKMVSYCSQDVYLLEKIYKALMPYAKGMPNVSVYVDEVICPKCGSDNVVKRGYSYTNISKFQRWVCKDCGSWSRERKRVKPKNDILSNV